MSARRGWVERLSGGRETPTAQPPPSGPGPRQLPPVPVPEGAALRVVLVSRDNMLAGALRSLIEAPGTVRMLDWLSEDLDSAIRHADVVIVDMPPNLHLRTFSVIDGRFLGRTVVLLQEGEHAEALPPGPPRAILYRPLQIGELWTAITGTASPHPALPPLQDAPDAAPEQAEGEAPADGAAVEPEGQGLPVAESGRLIGLSGQELDPVVGPGQVAPGMDAATFERLSGWEPQERQSGARRGGEARRARAARAEARREQSRRERTERAEAREAARADADRERAAARAESRRAQVARAETRQAARAEARRARAVKSEERRTARAETRRARAAEAETRRAERAEARRAEAAAAKVWRAERAEARRVARAEAGRARTARREASRQARSAKAQVRQAARADARRTRAAAAEVRREQARQARAVRAEERRSVRAAAAQARAAQAEVRREQSRQAKAARAEARSVAREESRRSRAARAAARQVARGEARQVRAARAAARKVARGEARQVRAARAEVRRAGREAARRGRGAGLGVAWPAAVVVVMALVGVAAAGWRGSGGPDTLAGEVAVVRAAEGSEGGLVVQDPRIGPIEPLHALAVGAWLRATEAGSSLEGAIREARAPSRFLLAGVVALTVLLFLLLIRVGPGTGAAAGPGPAPPQGQEQGGRDRRWRLGAAALAGALVALDPVLVGSGRAATGTVLAVVLALGTLALAWGLPTRPTLLRLPLVAAYGGIALLVSPLALPVLAVPVVAELLQGRRREAWRDMAALGLGIGLWLVLPIWVAGQDLDAGQAGWLLGRPPGRGSIAASLAEAPLTWLLVAAGLVAAVLPWRHRSGARSAAAPGAVRAIAWTATTAVGALVAVVVGYPAAQALPFAVPAAAVSLALAGGSAVSAAGAGVKTPGTAGVVPRWTGAGVVVVLAGLLAAQGVDWRSRYGGPPEDGLARLVASVGDKTSECLAVNADGPDDRARLLAAGVTVTEFADGPAAHAAGVRYFVLSGEPNQGGPATPSLAAWVRQRGTRLVAHPSRTLSGLELWRVDAPPFDPVADQLPLPGGVFSNVSGSACGGYRVVDSEVGTFYTAYRAAGGKAVLGRPLGSVWTSDGPALQAFDTMVLGAVATAGGPPAVRPIELPPLLAKLDVEAVADANIPLPSARPPVTDRQAQSLLRDKLIARAYLGTEAATASADDWRRARDRFGRPLGMPQVMPDGAVRQPFERVVFELPADGGPVRPAALGRLAVRLGLVPKQAMRLEPVPGLPARPAETRLDAGPLLRLAGGGLLLLGLVAVIGAVAASRARTARSG